MQHVETLEKKWMSPQRQGKQRGCRCIMNAYSHLNAREDKRSGGEHIASSLVTSPTGIFDAREVKVV